MKSALPVSRRCSFCMAEPIQRVSVANALELQRVARAHGRAAEMKITRGKGTSSHERRWRTRLSAHCAFFGRTCPGTRGARTWRTAEGRAVAAFGGSYSPLKRLFRSLSLEYSQPGRYAWRLMNFAASGMPTTSSFSRIPFDRLAAAHGETAEQAEFRQRHRVVELRHEVNGLPFLIASVHSSCGSPALRAARIFLLRRIGQEIFARVLRENLRILRLVTPCYRSRLRCRR